MCSLKFNQTFDEVITELRSDGKMIEGKLKRMAFEANPTMPGLLDALDNHIKRMPDDLKDIRKRTIGRHRIFYTGHHTQCSYTFFYLKSFKKTGVDDEDDSSFQEKLKKALCSQNSRVLEEPKTAD